MTTVGLLSAAVADQWSPRHGGGPGGERRGEAEDGTDVHPDGGAGASVDDWAHRLRSDAAAQLRRREAWLRRQAADDASLGGVLVDLAENGSLVALTTQAGTRHLGRVRGAGAEVVVLEVGSTQVVVTVDSVTTVQAVPEEQRRTVSPVGHRVGADGTTLADLLSHAVGDRAEVTLVMRGGQVVSGALEAVGRDVAIVRPPDRAPAIYARLSSVSEASLPASTRSG